MIYELSLPLEEKLEKNRLDYAKVNTYLAYIVLGLGNISIEDIMCAYLVASEWCVWAKNPKMAENPLENEKKFKKSDYASLFEQMNYFKRQMEIKLTKEVFEVRNLFLHLHHSCLNAAVLLSSNPDVPHISERTKRYYKRLACTAEFFEKIHGQDEFSNLLYKKRNTLSLC
ncbi:MAG: hypothetical protein J6Y53_03560 [Alphaproteobacteria bacterium]|nr:hypothetical protein [Alphaproteobacteria bacterium]